MNDKFLKLIVNLHDGDSAGAADGGDGNGENGEATSTDDISREMRERAERIGIGDDLIDDYNKAFGNGNQNQNNAEGENNSTDTDGEENSEEEFEKLIKGKYKNVYQNRVQSLVKDRLSTKDKQISDMQKRESTGNQIFALIANKYNVQPDDLDGLLKAVTEDKDLFAEKALAAGVTTEEARNDFSISRKQMHRKKSLKPSEEKKPQESLTRI